jgi:hypothetical protein
VKAIISKLEMRDVTHNHAHDTDHGQVNMMASLPPRRNNEDRSHNNRAQGVFGHGVENSQSSRGGWKNIYRHMAFLSIPAQPTQHDHMQKLGSSSCGKGCKPLQLQHVAFLMDNLSIARTTSTKSARDPQVLREIRQQIVQFKHASPELTPKVHHIARDLNGVAHNCVQQPIRQTQSEPNSSCTNSAHANGKCAAALALHN